jgi:hypothetical protein
MRRITLLLAVAFVVAPLPAAAQDGAPPAPAPSGPPAGLRPGEVLFRPLVGRPVWFFLRTKLESLQKAGKKRFPGAGETGNDVALTVGKRGDDGAFPVSIRIARATGWWEDADHPRTEFDTLKEPIPRDHPAWFLFGSVAPSSIRVLDDGRIAEIVGMCADMPRLAPLPATDRARQEYSSGWSSGLGLFGFAGTWPVLPPKRMGAGTFFETESVPPVSRGLFHLLRLRHELKKLDDQRVVLDTKGGVDDLDPATGSGPAGRSKGKSAASAGPRIKSSGFAQSSEVDRADGLVRKSSARFTLVMEQRFSVDGDSVDGTSTWTWEATLERRDAPPDLPKEALDPPAPPAPPTPAPAPPPGPSPTPPASGPDVAPTPPK